MEAKTATEQREQNQEFEGPVRPGGCSESVLAEDLGGVRSGRFEGDASGGLGLAVRPGSRWWGSEPGTST